MTIDDNRDALQTGRNESGSEKSGTTAAMAPSPDSTTTSATNHGGNDANDENGTVNGNGIDQICGSTISMISTNELHHPARVVEVIKHEGNNLHVQIIEANKSNDMNAHNLQGYIVYFIKFGSLSVKRRYSEFEALRSCLVKEFPTIIVPPIPEKQSLKSNIALTTSNSLGLATATLNSISDSQNSHNTSNLSRDMNHHHSIESESNDALSRRSEADPLKNLVEFRKRMLSEFLNKCLQNEKILASKFFLHFFDPEINYMDYVSNKENSVLYKTSIYRLSPSDPLNNLENQLYLTLPIPSSADSHLFKELSEEEQFQKFVNFEMKFIKYELVLNNIMKVNKHILKYYRELSLELSELGSMYNQLSLIQESDMIEHIGKLFERHNILLSSFEDSIDIGFLDKLIELKHFSTTCKELMEYNRKKLIQFKLVEKELYSTRSKYKRYESEELRIRAIDQKTQNALHHNNNNGSGGDEYTEPPIGDEELQTALYSKSSQKTMYGKIPGMSKLNNMILKYVSDPNPDETRRTKFYNIKVRLVQLERQQQLMKDDVAWVNKCVITQLDLFHQWFKRQLYSLTVVFNTTMQNYITSSGEPWNELSNQSK